MSSDEGVWWIWRGHFTELFLGLGLLLSHCWGAQVRRSPLKAPLALSESAAASLYFDWPPNLPDIIYYRNLSYIIIYYRYLTNTPIINMLSWYVMISYISIYIYIFTIYTYDEWHICVQIFTLHKLWVNWSPTGHQVTSELLAALMERESKTSAEKVGCWTG